MIGRPSDAVGVVVRRLRAVRWRWRGRAALIGFLATAVVAVGTVFAVRLAARVLGLDGPVVAWALDGTLAAGIIGVGVFASLFVAGAFAPSLTVLALRADARFGLHERLTAALETATATAEDSRLVGALRMDAARHAARVEPAVLVPIPWRRAALWALAPVAFAVTMPGLPDADAPIAAGRQGSSAPIPMMDVPLEDERVRENVRRIALLLNAEAAARQDDEIAELARTFEDLSQRLAAGTASVAEVGADLREATDRAAYALGLAEQTGVRAGDGLGDRPGDVGDRSPANTATRRPGEEAPIDEGRGFEALDRTAGPGANEMTLDSLLERLEMDALAQAAPDENANLDDVRFRQGQGDLDDGTYFDSPALQEATEQIMDNIRRQQDAQAREGGTAFDGTGRTGNQAGGAAAPIDEGVRGARLDDEVDAVDELLLPAIGRPTGRRIELHPPTAYAADGTSGVVDDAVDSGAWRPTQAVAFAPEVVSWRHSDVIGAFFTPAVDDRGVAETSAP